MLSFDATTKGTTNMNSTVSTAVASYAATRSGMVSQGMEGRVVTRSLYTMPDEDPLDGAEGSSRDSADEPIVVLTTTGEDKVI
jgi:hypothetical protein